MPEDPLEADLTRALGYKRLHPAWGKVEIFLGLAAVGFAVYLLGSAAVGPASLLGGLALFVLGGYLTLAGHRSHLYRSMNDQTRLLIREIRRAAANGVSHEYPRR